MKNNIGIFTDIHIGLENSSEFFHKENIKLAHWIKEEFTRNKIQNIFILGDVFHNRKQINLESLHNAYEFFTILKDFDIHILTGNHDCFYLDNSSVHSLSIFKGWNNIVVYDQVQVLENFGIAMIPWGTKIDDIPEADYIFGHFEISGFEMQGAVCKHGLTGSELAKKANKAVYSGHFHKPQMRQYNQGNIYYLGSPYQHNFGERDEDKFIYSLDLNSHVLTPIVNTISPKHYYVPQDETDFSKYQNNICRPIVTDPDKQDEFMLKLKSVAPSYIKDPEIKMESEIKISETLENFKMTVFQEDIQIFVDGMEIDENYKDAIVEETLGLYETIINS